MIAPTSLFHWLTLAALADWLIGRTLTRAAIHMPKTPFLITVYEGFNLIGQFAATLAGLLALAGLLWIVWHELGTRRAGLPLLLAALAALSLVFVVVAPSGGLALAYQIAGLAAVILIMARVARMDARFRLSLLVPAMAMLLSAAYQAIPALFEALRWPNPLPLADVCFYLGEVFVVLSPVALWLAVGRPASRRVWLAAALPALFFAVMYLASPSMTGVMAIWSTGLTLYLPWPMYTLSLWLAGVTVIVAVRRGDPVGMALVLLAAGGYAPQLSAQWFMGLIGLWLLARPALAPDAPRLLRREASAVA